MISTIPRTTTTPNDIFKKCILIHNLSSYVNVKYEDMIMNAIHILREKDCYSIAPNSKEIDHIEYCVKNNIININTIVELGDLLVQCSYYDEAYYFYFFVIKQQYPQQKEAIHDAYLQIAKMLFSGNIYQKKSKLLALCIFKYLVNVFDSEEAKLYL